MLKKLGNKNKHFRRSSTLRDLDLSDSDILFGFWQRKEDYLFINHMLVLAKQHIYECRNKCTYPSFTVF